TAEATEFNRLAGVGEHVGAGGIVEAQKLKRPFITRGDRHERAGRHAAGLLHATDAQELRKDADDFLLLRRAGVGCGHFPKMKTLWVARRGGNTFSASGSVARENGAIPRRIPQYTLRATEECCEVPRAGMPAPLPFFSVSPRAADTNN